MTNYTYTEKPKTVKAVQWDGTLAGAQDVYDIITSYPRKEDPLGQMGTTEVHFVPGQPRLDLLGPLGQREDICLTKGMWLVVEDGYARSMSNRQFESKYQAKNASVKDPDQDKAMEGILDKIKKEAKKRSPYETTTYIPPITPQPPWWERGPGPWQPNDPSKIYPTWLYPNQTWVSSDFIRDTPHDALHDATIWGTGFYKTKI